MMMTTFTTSTAEAPAPEPQHRNPWRRRSWVVLAALALVLGGLAIYGVTRHSDSATAFSWDGGDLGDWVSEAEMTEALEDVLLLHADSDVDAEVVLDQGVDGGYEWRWTYRTADGREWRVIAHDGAHGGRTADLALTQTDPRLPDGVLYEPGSGFAHGFYVLSGPNSDESICMTLWPPQASPSYPSTADVSTHEDRVLALASTMLREMRWAD